MTAGERAARWLAEHPRWVALGLGLVLAAALAALPHLRFDSDINRVFLSESPLSRAQRDFEGRFDERLSTVAILVEAEQGLAAEDYVRARDLSLDLELMDGVAAVTSPFVLRFPERDPAHPGEPVFPDRIEPGEVAARLDAFRDLGSGLPTLVTPGSLLMLAAVDVDSRPLADILPAIRAAAQGLDRDGVRATLSGEDVVSLAIAEGLKSDLVRLNLMGVGLVLLVAFALLRDLRLLLITVVPAIASAVLTLGFAAAAGFPITVLNNVIPVLILVLGVANGLHLTVHLSGETGDLTDRIAGTLVSVGPAVLLTVATTAIAFGSVMLVSNAQLVEFAMLGAAGMVIAALVLMPGFALLVRLLRPGARPLAGGLSAAASRIGGTALAAPRATLGAGAVVLGLSILGFATLTPWFPLYRNLPADSDLSAVNDRIEKDFGGVFQSWVEMPEGADWPAYVRAVRAVEDVAPEGAVLSELAVARLAGNAEDAPAPDLLAQLPGAASDRLADPRSGVRRFAVAGPEPMRSPQTLAAYDRMEGAALSAGAARVIGLPAVMRHEALRLIDQLSRSLLLASLTGAAVVALWFRSLRLLPVMLLVNVLPVLVLGAALHLLDGGRLTPPAVLSLTIAFGVAVDDSVHFYNRYRQARVAGALPRDAATRAMHNAGGVMILTTILICAGLIVTLASDFFPVRLFGEMMILTLVVALLSDLVLLPVLLVLGAVDATS